MEKIQEKLGGMMMPDPQELLNLMELAKKLNLLMDVLPAFEVKILKVANKEYTAILFERPPKKA